QFFPSPRRSNKRTLGPMCGPHLSAARNPLRGENRENRTPILEKRGGACLAAERRPARRARSAALARLFAPLRRGLGTTPYSGGDKRGTRRLPAKPLPAPCRAEGQPSAASENLRSVQVRASLAPA